MGKQIHIEEPGGHQTKVGTPTMGGVMILVPVFLVTVVLNLANLLSGVGWGKAVLRLFKRDPFAGKRPALVRTVLWQYWFTDLATKRKTGTWWRRTEIGPFSGVVGQQ
jgi:UDP-N-acetylmuramyl pentapeptide phosphotransferase/UDP-N-acetylglucosamine-1-phosphate transferase